MEEPSHEHRKGHHAADHRAAHTPIVEGMSSDSAVEDSPDALKEQADRHMRLAADFENFKRRKAQELIDRSRYASEDAARALLPVLDNLRRAVEHLPSEKVEASVVDGLHLVVREFETALEKLGVVPLETVGTPFDPSVHEAIAGEVADTDIDCDMVIDEVQPGYRLHDRLIRPALVRVAHPRSAGE